MVCLKTNGDSAQLPVPATPSITRQHMYGSDNGRTLKAKVCICEAEQTSTYGTDVEAFKGRRIEATRCNAQGQLLPFHLSLEKDRNYTRNVTLSDTRFGAVRTFFHHQSFSREWIRKSFLIRSDLHTIMCVL